MAAVIKLVQGDDLPGITFAIKDSRKAAAWQELDSRDPSTWAIVNLTGCTVSAVVSAAGVYTAIEAVRCFVVDAISGHVLLDIKDSVFVSTVGQYQIEVTVEFPEGTQTVYDMLQLDVRERISNAP